VQIEDMGGPGARKVLAERVYTIEARVWPGRPMTRERVIGIVGHEHRDSLHGLPWRVVYFEAVNAL
jgi:hypothetical protein